MADLVRQAHAEFLTSEEENDEEAPVDFSTYYQACWHALNKKFEKLSSSRQFEMMGEVCETLSDNREAVMTIVGEGGWEGRRDGLEVCVICQLGGLCWFY